MWRSFWTRVQLPPPPPTKKPLLSTRAKEVFSCILGKKRAKHREIGLRGGRSAASGPFFCFQQQEQPKNAGVLFAFLCSAKKEQKGVGGGTRILTQPVYFAVNQILRLKFQKVLDIYVFLQYNVYNKRKRPEFDRNSGRRRAS